MRKLILVLLLAPIFALGQTTVTLMGNNYTLQSHPRVLLDGPTGALTKLLSNPAKATMGYPPYAAAVKTVSGWNGLSYDADAAGGQGARYLLNGLLWLANGANPSDTTYLPTAMWGVQNPQDTAFGTFACNQTTTYCGRGAQTDFPSYMSLPYYAQLFSIMRSQMTSAQITAFANMMLNDNSVATGGLGMPGSPTTSCTPQPYYSSGTVTLTTTGGTYQKNAPVTASSPIFDSTWVGGTIFAGSGMGTIVGRVAAVTDSTHATLSLLEKPETTATAFTYSLPWQAGQCGLVWFLKHHTYQPAFATGINSTNYPTRGSSISSSGLGASVQDNLVYTKLYGYIMLALALADDDPRAQTLLTQSYNFFMANSWAWSKSTWTGFNQSGCSYTGRVQFFIPQIAAAIQNSVIKGPKLAYIGDGTALGSYTIRSILPFMYQTRVPGIPLQGEAFGQVGLTCGGSVSSFGYGLATAYLYAGTTESKLYNYWVQNMTGKWTATGLQYAAGEYMPPLLIFSNPNAPTQDLTLQPTQYVFNQTEYSDCANWGISCSAFAPFSYQFAVSKSNWTGSATQLFIQAGFYGDGDHNNHGAYGVYHIWRGTGTSGSYLLAGDSAAGQGEAYNTGVEGSDNLIELGAANNWTIKKSSGFQPGMFAPISRWTGDASSRFAYAQVDMTNTYKASVGATRVRRDIAHLKEGAQDYIISYDDVATSSGNEKRAFWHYYLVGKAPTASVNSKDLTARNQQASSLLLSQFLPVQGADTDVLSADDTSTGAYAGGRGYTFRTYVCASADGVSCNTSATSMEYVAVHRASGNTADIMPAIKQPPAGSSWTAVQIDDPSRPQVVVFARQGATPSALAVTTDHAGVAQYLIAGVSPATYTIRLNGSTIATQTATTNSNTLYFESTAGAITVGKSR